jgi:hypothetical protein
MKFECSLRRRRPTVATTPVGRRKAELEFAWFICFDTASTIVRYHEPCHLASDAVGNQAAVELLVKLSGIN